MLGKLVVVAVAMFFRLSPVLRGAAVGMALFSVYHLFFVLPIMAHAGRFYAPMAPMLTLLAAFAAEAIVERIRLYRWSAWIGMAAVPVVVAMLAHHWLPASNPVTTAGRTRASIGTTTVRLTPGRSNQTIARCSTRR